MINGLAHARAFAGRIKTALRPTRATHGQALDLAGRVLGARDWRSYVAAPAAATRADIEPRLRAELAVFGTLDADAIVAHLLPPATPTVRLRAIKARCTPLDLMKSARRGHAVGYQGPLAGLADEWTTMIVETDEADPGRGTSQLWDHIYHHDGFDDSPIARDYHEIIGRWPSERTATMLMEHVLDGTPLTGRAARSRAFREAADRHRQAVATLVPVAAAHEGVEMLAVHAQTLNDDALLLTWTRMAHMDVEGDSRSINMVRAWSVATLAQPGWNLAQAAEASVVAELHIVAVDTEGRSDRSLAYWMEAHDGDMDDVQKALRLQFAPSRGHRTFDTWASDRRARGKPADVYVVDGFTSGSDADAVGPSLRGAIANVEAGVAGCLPFTRDMPTLAASLVVGVGGILDAEGQPARIGDEAGARILALHGPGPHHDSDVMPRVGAAGVVVASARTGLDLASLLTDRETLVYDDRRLPSQPPPRRPEGMPNPLLGSRDQVHSAIRMADDIIDQVRLKVPGADPEEVTALFAQAVGGACRGKVDPHRLAFDSMIAAGMSSIQASARLAELDARTADEIGRITRPDYAGGVTVSEDGVFPVDERHTVDEIDVADGREDAEGHRAEENERAAIMIHRVVHLIEQQVDRGYQAELGGAALRRAADENDDDMRDVETTQILELLLLNAVPMGDAVGARRPAPEHDGHSTPTDRRDAAPDRSNASILGAGTTLERLATAASLLGVRLPPLRDASQAGTALGLLERHLGITGDGYLGARLAAVERHVERRVDGTA